LIVFSNLGAAPLENDPVTVWAHKSNVLIEQAGI
jgi:hypothetical protein